MRGKRIKVLRSGRKYVLEVRHGGKLKGYVNNVGSDGKPVAKEFTISMLNRLKHTRKKLLEGERREQSHSFKITNKKRVKLQIPIRVIREIKARKKVAFGFRIEFGQTRLITPFIYSDGKLKEEYLRNSITSSILLTLNGNRFRISPLLKDQTELKKVTRLQEATCTLEFIDIGGLSAGIKQDKDTQVQKRLVKKKTVRASKAGTKPRSKKSGAKKTTRGGRASGRTARVSRGRN